MNQSYTVILEVSVTASSHQEAATFALDNILSHGQQLNFQVTHDSTGETEDVTLTEQG